MWLVRDFDRETCGWEVHSDLILNGRHAVWWTTVLWEFLSYQRNISIYFERDWRWNNATRYRNAPSCFWVLSADLLFFCISSGQLIPVLRFFFGVRERVWRFFFFWGNYACARDGFMTTRPETARESVDTNVNIGIVSRSPHLQEVVSTPQNFCALMSQFIWDRFVYPSKLWSAMPKSRSAMRTRV